MRLRADSKEAENVKGVELNGRPMAMVVEFDTDEGWVRIAIPKELPKLNSVPGVDPTEAVEAGEFEWVEKIYHGEVKVFFLDNPKEEE